MGPIIYFCGSIRGGRQDAELYARLIQKLKTYGEVLTEHIGNDEKIAANLEKMTDKDIYEQDMKWLERSDVVVAEVTQPSLGVGVEIGRAISLKKRTLCLFRPSSGKYLSALISGAENGDQFVVKSYAEKEVDDILKSFLSEKQEEGSGDKAE